MTTKVKLHERKQLGFPRAALSCKFKGYMTIEFCAQLIKMSHFYRNRNRNRKLQTSKAPLKSQAQGTSLFTSAASNQRGFPKNLYSGRGSLS